MSTFRTHIRKYHPRLLLPTCLIVVLSVSKTSIGQSFDPTVLPAGGCMTRFTSWLFDTHYDPAAEATKLRKGAEQGNAGSQYCLGRALMLGEGVAKDPVEAVTWLRKAADQGNASAVYGIGAMLMSGYGMTNDPAEAVKWYRKAADGGESYGEYALGAALMSGHGVNESPAEAMKWFHKAIVSGTLVDAFKFGSLLMRGDGVAIDSAEAVRWLRKAAEAGDVYAAGEFGVALIYGDGVAKDRFLGVKWLRRAVEGTGARPVPSTEALYLIELSKAHFRGEGALKDEIECAKYLMLASERGNTNAVALLELLRESGELGRGEEAEARQRAQRWDTEHSEESTRASATVAPRDTGGEELVASGTGFVVSDDGYFLTCSHVIAEAEKIAVTIQGAEYKAKVAKRDVVNDLVLLKLDGGTFEVLPVVPDMRFMGEHVSTIGYPSPELQGVSAKYTEGVISAESGIMDDIRCYQISVPVQPGNSGGPLLDSSGNVVGVVVAKLSASIAFQYSGSLPENVNYAVKSSYAIPLLQSIPGLWQKLPKPRETGAATKDFVATAEKAVGCVRTYK